VVLNPQSTFSSHALAFGVNLSADLRREYLGEKISDQCLAICENVSVVRFADTPDSGGGSGNAFNASCMARRSCGACGYVVDLSPRWIVSWIMRAGSRDSRVFSSH
jgi:hypothetical protein